MPPGDDGGSDLPDSAGGLIGQDEELAFIGSFVERAATGGGALLMSGDAGVGKTLLLEVAAARAASAGITVVRVVGAEFEADVSFAGLNQVLHRATGLAPGRAKPGGRRPSRPSSGRSPTSPPPA